MFFTVALFLIAVSQVHGHTYHLGNCPTVSPMIGFDMAKFLGKWFVIQKTATGSSCLVNIYTEDKENPGHFKIEQISENLILGITNADKKYHYTGDLVAPDSTTPAKMKVQFPLNVAGGASYTVFDTDYDTYAGIFTCQQLAFAHRRSTTIISRAKTLDNEYVSKIREKLSGFGIDPYDLSIIRQGNCTDAKPSEVDEKVFSVENVAQVFRKAGEKIGEGFESVAEQAKKVYTNIRESQTEEKQEGDPIKRNMKEDAEWLP